MSVGSPEKSAASLSPGSDKPLSCSVCGDTAVTKYYGAISCRPCGRFYRRYKKNGMNFVPGPDCPCEIDRYNRKCQYCRYQKCTSTGMGRQPAGTFSNRYENIVSAPKVHNEDTVSNRDEKNITSTNVSEKDTVSNKDEKVVPPPTVQNKDAIKDERVVAVPVVFYPPSMLLMVGPDSTMQLPNVENSTQIKGTPSIQEIPNVQTTPYVQGLSNVQTTPSVQELSNEQTRQGLQTIQNVQEAMDVEENTQDTSNFKEETDATQQPMETPNFHRNEDTQSDTKPEVSLSESGAPCTVQNSQNKHVSKNENQENGEKIQPSAEKLIKNFLTEGKLMPSIKNPSLAYLQDSSQKRYRVLKIRREKTCSTEQPSSKFEITVLPGQGSQLDSNPNIPFEELQGTRLSQDLLQESKSGITLTELFDQSSVASKTPSNISTPQMSSIALETPDASLEQRAASTITPGVSQDVESQKCSTSRVQPHMEQNSCTSTRSAHNQLRTTPANSDTIRLSTDNNQRPQNSSLFTVNGSESHEKLSGKKRAPEIDLYPFKMRKRPRLTNHERKTELGSMSRFVSVKPLGNIMTERNGDIEHMFKSFLDVDEEDLSDGEMDTYRFLRCYWDMQDRTSVFPDRVDIVSPIYPDEKFGVNRNGGDMSCKKDTMNIAEDQVLERHNSGNLDHDIEMDLNENSTERLQSNFRVEQLNRSGHDEVTLIEELCEDQSYTEFVTSTTKQLSNEMDNACVKDVQIKASGTSHEEQTEPSSEQRSLTNTPKDSETNEATNLEELEFTALTTTEDMEFSYSEIPVSSNSYPYCGDIADLEHGDYDSDVADTSNISNDNAEIITSQSDAENSESITCKSEIVNDHVCGELSNDKRPGENDNRNAAVKIVNVLNGCEDDSALDTENISPRIESPNDEVDSASSNDANTSEMVITETGEVLKIERVPEEDTDMTQEVLSGLENVTAQKSSGNIVTPVSDLQPTEEVTIPSENRKMNGEKNSTDNSSEDLSKESLGINGKGVLRKILVDENMTCEKDGLQTSISKEDNKGDQATKFHKVTLNKQDGSWSIADIDPADLDETAVKSLLEDVVEKPTTIPQRMVANKKPDRDEEGNDRAVFCLFCSEQHVNWYALQLHIEYNHLHMNESKASGCIVKRIAEFSEERDICSFCLETVSHEVSLESHYEWCTKLCYVVNNCMLPDAEACCFCEKKFFNHKSLRAHITLCSLQNLLLKPLTYFRQLFEIENMIPMDDATFVCLTCSKTFTSTGTLEKHIRLEHRFAIKRRQSEVRKILKPLIKCSECLENFKTVRDFHDHVAMKHNPDREREKLVVRESEEIENNDNSTGNVGCPENRVELGRSKKCNVDAQEGKDGMKTSQTSDNVESLAGNAVDLLICTICGVLCRSVNNRQEHERVCKIRREQKEEINNTLTCGCCQKVFTREVSLNAHMHICRNRFRSSRYGTRARQRFEKKDSPEVSNQPISRKTVVDIDSVSTAEKQNMNSELRTIGLVEDSHDD